MKLLKCSFLWIEHFLPLWVKYSTENHKKITPKQSQQQWYRRKACFTSAVYPTPVQTQLPNSSNTPFSLLSCSFISCGEICCLQAWCFPALKSSFTGCACSRASLCSDSPLCALGFGRLLLSERTRYITSCTCHPIVLSCIAVQHWGSTGCQDACVPYWSGLGLGFFVLFSFILVLSIMWAFSVVLSKESHPLLCWKVHFSL